MISEILPENRLRSDKNYKTEFEIRYWEILQKLREKLRGCNAETCPIVYERKLHHMAGRHAAANSCTDIKQNQTIYIPKATRSTSPRASFVNLASDVNELNQNELINTSNSKENNVPSAENENVKDKTDNYKNDVRKIVANWYNKFYNNTNYLNRTVAEERLDELIQDIQNLESEINTNGYELKITNLTRKFINDLSIFESEVYENYEKYYNYYFKELVYAIIDLNRKYYNDYNRASNSEMNSNKTPQLRNIVTNWFNITGFDKLYFEDILNIVSQPIDTVEQRNEVKDELINALIRIKRVNSEEYYKLKYINVSVDMLFKIIDYENEKHLKETGCITKIYSSSFTDSPYNTELSRKVFIHVDNFLEQLVAIEKKKLITEVIVDYVGKGNSVEAERNATMRITNILVTNTDPLPLHLCTRIAQNLIETTKENFADELRNNTESFCFLPIMKTVSVYTSLEMNPMIYPVTSTPKQKTEKVQRLNKAELEYMNAVNNLIAAWVHTLPEQFRDPNDKKFMDIMITSLAGDITDVIKLEQLAPGTMGDVNRHLQYQVYKWFYKLDVPDINEFLPQINDLVAKLITIPQPVLTKPQHGNRQLLENIKYNQTNKAFEESYIPEAGDILEDEISIWVNNLPPEIFVNKTSNNVHELAEAIKPKLKEKSPENEVKTEVAKWLGKVVKDNKRNEINELADNLTGRVVGLPQDNTIAAAVAQRREITQEIDESKTCCQNTAARIEDTDPDDTMKEFIVKYIDHNYDIDDPMARGAFSHLLKKELQRLTPISQEEVYVCPAMANKHERLSPEKLLKELDYIKIVSDWLKNMPVEPEYNTVGNKRRVDFVIDLAKTIQENEEERAANPKAMDYNTYIVPIIVQYLVNLPLTVDRRDKYLNYELNNLMNKIIEHRKVINRRKKSKTLDTSGIHTDNIGDFIEEFVKINGNDIGDDEVKMEAWCVRLLREIKQMIRESPDPNAITKGQVYDRIADVPIPGDESIQVFELELEYIKQISEWIKNLPLLPLEKEEEENRIVVITELAEKMAERDRKPNTAENNKEFDDYVASWIQRLPLDRNKEIVMPVLLQQLKKRMDKVKHKDESENLDKTSLKSKSSTISKHKVSKALLKNPEKGMIDAIKRWSASLPIKTEDPAEAKTIKNNVAKRLYQKVGEYNLDPQIANNDPLYKQMISDEIDSIIDGLPQNPKLKSERHRLKTELVKTLVDGKTLIIEKTAGDTYKHKLENTIDASLPNPISPKKVYDPGFEIYKHRLADMFILENFDHGDDDVKVKYEKAIKHEIDKYFDNVKNKNAVALTNDEIYNELYSALFKVPIPNETSTAEEVEEIKTRCVIEAWFEDLPLKEADGLGELLEWDNILSTLAKRIHEIEKESKPPNNAKIHKEIMKWLVKLPILPEREDDNEMFAKQLEEILKLSATERACGKKPKNLKEYKAKTDKLKGKGKTTKPKHKNFVEPIYPNNITLSWASHDKPRRKAGDVVLELVKTWADTVPIMTGTPELEEQADMLRKSLVTQMIVKISELNTNPNILNDDFVYNELLDQELEKQLAKLPFCCSFDKNMKKSTKTKLKEALQSVKPLIKDEQAKSNYKRSLKNTVDNVLDKPDELTADKEKEFIALKNEIVDNFVQYNYDKDNEVGRQEYRARVDEAIIKFLTDISKNKEGKVDPLITRNQLMAELAKIPLPPEDQLQGEIDEIRMKEEINEFFDEVGVKPVKGKPVDQIKMSLAKKLTDIENAGHNRENDMKMKQEIHKSLMKADKVSKPEDVDRFVKKLEANENSRKSKKIMKLNDNKSKTLCYCEKYQKKEVKKEVKEKISNDKNRLVSPHCECKKYYQNKSTDETLKEYKPSDPKETTPLTCNCLLTGKKCDCTRSINTIDLKTDKNIKLMSSKCTKSSKKHALRDDVSQHSDKESLPLKPAEDAISISKVSKPAKAIQKNSFMNASTDVPTTPPPIPRQISKTPSRISRQSLPENVKAKESRKSDANAAKVTGKSSPVKSSPPSPQISKTPISGQISKSLSPISKQSLPEKVKSKESKCNCKDADTNTVNIPTKTPSTPGQTPKSPASASRKSLPENVKAKESRKGDANTAKIPAKSPTVSKKSLPDNVKANSICNCKNVDTNTSKRPSSLKESPPKSRPPSISTPRRSSPDTAKGIPKKLCACKKNNGKETLNKTPKHQNPMRKETSPDKVSKQQNIERTESKCNCKNAALKTEGKGRSASSTRPSSQPGKPRPSTPQDLTKSRHSGDKSIPESLSNSNVAKSRDAKPIPWRTCKSNLPDENPEYANMCKKHGAKPKSDPSTPPSRSSVSQCSAECKRNQAKRTSGVEGKTTQKPMNNNAKQPFDEKAHGSKRNSVQTSGIKLSISRPATPTPSQCSAECIKNQSKPSVIEGNLTQKPVNNKFPKQYNDVNPEYERVCKRHGAKPNGNSTTSISDIYLRKCPHRPHSRVQINRSETNFIEAVRRPRSTSSIQQNRSFCPSQTPPLHVSESLSRSCESATYTADKACHSSPSLEISDEYDRCEKSGQGVKKGNKKYDEDADDESEGSDDECTCDVHSKKMQFMMMMMMRKYYMMNYHKLCCRGLYCPRYFI